MDTDAEFFGIANEMVSDEANEVLDRHLKRAKVWLELRRSEGESAQLRDLIMKLMDEPNKRKHVMTVYATALWRLLEMERQ